MASRPATTWTLFGPATTWTSLDGVAGLGFCGHGAQRCCGPNARVLVDNRQGK